MGGARGLLLSFRPGNRQALQFDEDVEQVSILTLKGRSVLSKRKDVGGPIVIELQSSSEASLALPSGIVFVQVQTASGEKAIYPAVVAK